MLRRIFVESAWIAIRKDLDLMKVYERIKKTSGAKKAIVGVARRLAGRVRVCLKKEEVYKINFLKTENVNVVVKHRISA